MTTYEQVWRARVPDGNVEQLGGHPARAVAEARRLCPELLRADLVRLDDGWWWDVSTCNCPDGEEHLMARAAEFDALHTMHALLEDAEQVARREVVSTA